MSYREEAEQLPGHLATRQETAPLQRLTSALFVLAGLMIVLVNKQFAHGVVRRTRRETGYRLVGGSRSYRIAFGWARFTHILAGLGFVVLGCLRLLDIV
jgi:hypothetical protein